MAHIVTGTFDGHVMQFDEPPPFPANTRLVGTLEQEKLEPEYEPQEPRNEVTEKPTSFIEAALAMKVEGPSDWSERVDHYLYGGMADEEG